MLRLRSVFLYLFRAALVNNIRFGLDLLIQRRFDGTHIHNARTSKCLVFNLGCSVRKQVVDVLSGREFFKLA